MMFADLGEKMKNWTWKGKFWWFFFHTFSYFFILFYTFPYFFILFHTFSYFFILFHTFSCFFILFRIFHTFSYFFIFFSIFHTYHTFSYFHTLFTQKFIYFPHKIIYNNSVRIYNFYNIWNKIEEINKRYLEGPHGSLLVAARTLTYKWIVLLYLHNRLI